MKNTDSGIETVNKENNNSPNDSLIGEVIDDKYQIIELIGAGGMGRVYKAKHLLMGQIVAVKVLSKELTEKPLAMKRFAREAQAASRMDHINVVAVRGFGICKKNKVAYLAMQNLEGKSLKKVLSEEGKLNIARCLNLFIQICAGLSEAHRKKIVHRDMKPSNVLLTEHNGNNDTVKIIDFGIAQVNTADGATVLETLTATQEMIGTPSYMSPEQVSGKEIDQRSDIYSVGCMLYETLTGRVPFKDETLATVCMLHLTGQPPRLVMQDGDPILVQRLDTIIQKCLAKEPSMRYQDIEDLQSHLEQVQFRLKQLESENANKALLAMEMAWLLLSQAIRKLKDKVFSKQISSSGITIGSVTIIASFVLVFVVAISTIVLFASLSTTKFTDRELWLKPIISSSAKQPDQNTADPLWHKLQSESEHQPDILERALRMFIKLGNLNQQAGNYYKADLLYSRAEQIVHWLKLDSSILFVDILNFHAENQLLANMSIGSLTQQRNEQALLKEKHFGLFVKPETLRSLGLGLSTNAALTRDYSLQALTIMNQLGKGESVQSLLAFALLAKSHIELNYGDLAMKPFETFRRWLEKPNLSDQLDKSRRAITEAWAGRAYMEHNKLIEAQELLTRSQSDLAELGISAQRDLAAVYNDLGLVYELKGENRNAELLYREAYSALPTDDRDARQQRFVILNNIANAALKSADYITAIKSKLAVLLKLSVQI